MIRKQNVIAFCFSCVVAIYACQMPADKGGSVKNDQAEQEVRSMLQAYFDSIRTRGLMAEFYFLDSTDRFFWVPPGYSQALDYDSVRTILLHNAALMTKTDFRWDTLSVLVLSDGLACYTGVVSGNSTDIKNNTSVIRLIESGTVIRRSGGWKLLCGQSAVLAN